jgi:hypothetical protein
MQHRYLNPTYGANDPDLQPSTDTNDWPGRAWGVRPPTPDEQPLINDEALLALRMGVARRPMQRTPEC